MSISVGGQAIPSPTLIAKPGSPSNAAQYPLLCDLQYMEPYATQGLNRKMRNIVLPGIYNGFKVSPGTGLTVNVSSTGESGGGASINIGTHWQVSINQLFDVSVPVKQGQWIVALKATYDPLNGVTTRQVNLNSTIEAAEFVVISAASGLQANMIEICRVNIPQVTQITDPMIDRTHRVERRIGLQLTDNTDQSDTDIAASALAVKKTWDEAQAIKAAALMRGEAAIGANAVHQLDMAFDWQNHRFVGGEYDLIDWDTSKTTTKGAVPDIDYPSGHYQVHVIGLSDTDNQTLLIRPLDYSRPLAPFMISWTGVAGSRAFKTRAIATAFADINSLGGVGPNDLTLICHSGTFGQLGSAQAISEKGYPFAEAGSLSVTPSAYGVQQEYTGFSSGRRAVRGRVAQQNGTHTWGDWSEYPTINHDALWQPEKKLGVAGFEQNSVYFDNRDRNNNKIAAGVRSEWYTHNVYAGIRRDLGFGTLGYSIEVDSSEVALFNSTSSNLNTGSFTTYFNANADSSVSMAPNAIRINATGTKHLWFNDATGVEVGIIYATDDKTIHMRAAQGPDFAVDYQGNAVLTGGGVMTVPSLHAVSGVYIGDGDSGFHESGDGRVAFHINSANQGYFKSGAMYYPLIQAAGLTVGGPNDFAAEAAAAFSIGSDNGIRKSASNAQLHLWGAGDRKTVLEFSDAQGYHFYTQRNVDDSIIFSINGSLSARNVTISGQLNLAGQNANFPLTLTGPSPSIMLSEVDSKLKTIWVADGTSWRIQDETTAGVSALAWDKTAKILTTDGIFRSNGGIAAGGNSGISGDLTVAGKITLSAAAPIIQFHETDVDKNILFVMDGGNCRLQEDSAVGREIFAWSRNATTLSTVGSFSAAGEIHTAQRITIGDNDSGLRAGGDGVVAFQANSKDIGYFSGSGIGINSGGSFYLEARERNGARFTNELFNTNGQIMTGGIVATWYENWLAFGLQRGGSTDMIGFTVWANGGALFSANMYGTMTIRDKALATQEWVGGNYCTIAQRDGINAVLATVVKDIRLNGRVGMSADGWSAAPDGAVVNGGGDFGSNNGSYSYTWVQKYTDVTGWVTVAQV